ncbi:reverse transcriptase domain-containing protein [Citrobacter koseri]|uniref:reverse transcriptase domain-containing protein n=1 Tax=Citrobacter koseri TaxID=545 RepID=UPI000E012934|nr:reverse transcriptase domain-containing protein [Citrobacter koseri]STB73298.1 reverse transcriptase [Citrobacter koseri]STT23477.1 Retron-type reverse transcriptase [Citrobacter koseri]
MTPSAINRNTEQTASPGLTEKLHPAGPYARLEQAWQWLEQQRRHAPDDADIWHLRHQAQNDGAFLRTLLQTLQAGEYRLAPLQLHGRGDERKAVWSARDALVLKWVALSIQEQLALHPACEHVKGHGGGKQSVQKLHGLLTQHHGDEKKTPDDREYAWVCRTDIRGYYRHIIKDRLYARVKRYVTDPVMLDLVHQYLHYSVEDGGAFHTPERGISRACSLSPLMGAVHLYEMDAHFSAQKQIHYARYMDDIIILAKTRWQLRRHTKRLKQWFSEEGFEAHPEKTQIGRTGKGFDWMGAWLTHEGATDIAPRAKANYREKVRRLYEQLTRLPRWLRNRRQGQVHARGSAYRRRWNIWAWGMIAGLCMGGHAHLLRTAWADASAVPRPIIVLSPTLPNGTGGGYLDAGTFGGSYTRSTDVYPNAAGATGGVSWGDSPSSASSSCGYFNDTGWTCSGSGPYDTRTPWGTYTLMYAPLRLGLEPQPGGILVVRVRSTSAGSGSIVVPWSRDYRNLLDCGAAAKQSDYDSFMLRCSTSAAGLVQYSQPMPVSSTVDITSVVNFAPVCLPGCVPGVVDRPLYYGASGTTPATTPAAYPTALVIAGFSCTLSVGGSPTQSTAPISTAAAPDQLLAVSGPVTLTPTCVGSNTTGAEIPFTLAFTGAAETRVTLRSGWGVLTAPDQPSFYGVLSSSSPQCGGSGNYTLGPGGTGDLWTVGAGPVPPTLPSATVIWGLCSTGDTSQAPGPYQLQVTATIVGV